MSRSGGRYDSVPKDENEHVAAAPTNRRRLMLLTVAAIVVSSIAIVGSLQTLTFAPLAAQEDPSGAPVINDVDVDASSTANLPPCDPYSLPGRLHSDYVFRPFDDLPGTNCRVNTEPLNNLEAAWAATNGTVDLPPHLRNKLVLYVSDSNDRNTIISTCQRMNGTLTTHMILDISIIPPGQDNQGDARLCVVRGPPGQVLVLVFIFNYGISNDSGEHRNHVRPGLSAKFVDVVDSVPPFLAKLAPVYFPELQSSTAGSFFTIHRGPIRPDLIVAQSSLWETAYWVNVIRNRTRETNTTFDVEDTMTYGFARLPTDLRTRFLPSFEKNFKGVPLVWRTCPTIANDPGEERPAWVVVQYNRFVRIWLGKLGVRVLDWEVLVDGRGWTDDKVHQNWNGRMVYSQMVLSELGRMWEMEEWKKKEVVDGGEEDGDP
ncbi:hypothetical protein HK101_001141 [Irineochytrium annulatum]|nr:hypothetical protein HK101_001141 [Irineochytrium annulatum]